MLGEGTSRRAGRTLGPVVSALLIVFAVNPGSADEVTGTASPVRDLAIHFDNSTTVNLTWQPPDYTPGTLQHYNVYTWRDTSWVNPADNTTRKYFTQVKPEQRVGPLLYLAYYVTAVTDSPDGGMQMEGGPRFIIYIELPDNMCNGIYVTLPGGIPPSSLPSLAMNGTCIINGLTEPIPPPLRDPARQQLITVWRMICVCDG